MTTASFDLSGDVRSTVPIGVITGVDHDGHLVDDFHAWRTASYATIDTLDRQTHDIHPDQPIHDGLRCDDCGWVGLVGLFDPDEPPDPDRHGNRRSNYRCPDCGADASAVWSQREPPLIDGATLVD
jgi:rubredoxin